MSTNLERFAEKRVLEVESGGAAVEAIGGLGVVVLSILGLVGLAPEPLAAIAGIVFGVAVLAQGAAVASEYSALFSRMSGGGAIELGTGMTVEITAGGAAIVLGILALLGIAPLILLPALIITGGAALILTTGTLQRLNHLKMAASASTEVSEQMTRVTAASAAGGQLLVGVAAIVLGIVAFASLPMAAAGAAAGTPAGMGLTLTLVGLLVIGASIAISGGALAGRFTQMFNHLTSGQST